MFLGYVDVRACRCTFCGYDLDKEEMITQLKRARCNADILNSSFCNRSHYLALSCIKRIEEFAAG